MPQKEFYRRSVDEDRSWQPRILRMHQGVIAFPAVYADAQLFTVEDLYDLQHRAGKQKTPTISYLQRNLLKSKLNRQDGLDCSFVRAVHHFWRHCDCLTNWLLWQSATDLDSGGGWLWYNLFGSSRVDNVRCGRARMSRLRRPEQKNSRDLLQLNQLYDPYRLTRC